jgi:hypothetical protein
MPSVENAMIAAVAYIALGLGMSIFVPWLFKPFVPGLDRSNTADWYLFWIPLGPIALGLYCVGSLIFGAGKLWDYATTR